jgi:hypothetical protein
MDSPGVNVDEQRGSGRTDDRRVCPGECDSQSQTRVPLPLPSPGTHHLEELQEALLILTLCVCSVSTITSTPPPALADLAVLEAETMVMAVVECATRFVTIRVR